MKNFLRSCISFATLLPFCLWSDQSITTNINGFAFSLYEKSLLDSDKNEIFSPFSLFQGMSTVYLGSQGTTRQEIENALNIDAYLEDFLASLQSLNQNFESSQNLHIANRVWTDPRIEVLPSYQETLSCLKASIESLSFTHPAKSCAVINEWVSGQTEGKISQLLAPQDISKNTRMILVNAISFEDRWLLPFSIQKTQNEPFYSLSGETKLVPMMAQEKHFPYYENEEMQLLLLPFQTESFACFIILPKNSLEASTSELLKADFSTWVQETNMAKVSVKIPRFKERKKYPMLPILSQLGIRQAFSGAADFSLISSDRLRVENVLHEAFFSLNESGVSATGATAIITGITSAVVRPTPSISFTANHPFLFGIVDLNSNVMLFLGKIVNL